MKTSTKSKRAESNSSDGDSIAAYSRDQSPAFRAMCDQLRELIDKEIPKATSKVWHGAPVWFIDENPVVGYDATAKAVKLLFWNGRAFGEPALQPVGKFRAAQAVFAGAADIEAPVVRRWLKKAKADVFDSNAFFQHLRAGR